MENKDVKYILAIERCGTITKAAEELFVSQPALSRFLRDKEREIGAPLFTRGISQMQPTELGKLYLKYATAIAETEKQCNDAIKEFLQRSKPKVTLCIPYSRVEWLFSYIDALQEKNPAYNVEISTDHSTGLYNAGKSGLYDLVITNRADEDAEGLFLAKEEILFRIPESVQKEYHLAEKGKLCPDGIMEIELSELQNVPLYLSADSNMLGAMSKKIFEQEEVSFKRVKIFDDSRMAGLYAKERQAISLALSTCDDDGWPIVRDITYFRLGNRYYNYLYLYQFNSQIHLTFPEHHFQTVF